MDSRTRGIGSCTCIFRFALKPGARACIDHRTPEVEDWMEL